MIDINYTRMSNINNCNMKKIECVIMDWAGTSVDYGCFAPVAAFVDSFKQMGLTVTAAETRAHMGLTKIEEIRALFAIERVEEEFRQKYAHIPDENDVQECYKRFQDVLFTTLDDYTDPIPGVVDVIAGLRAKGIKVGSTTGYTKNMMDMVIPSAEKKGYKIDACVTSDNLPGYINSPLCQADLPFFFYQKTFFFKFSDRFSVNRIYLHPECFKKTFFRHSICFPQSEKHEFFHLLLH